MNASEVKDEQNKFISYPNRGAKYKNFIRCYTYEFFLYILKSVYKLFCPNILHLHLFRKDASSSFDIM